MKKKYVLSLNEREDLTKYKLNSKKKNSNWNAANMNCNEESILDFFGFMFCISDYHLFELISAV